MPATATVQPTSSPKKFEPVVATSAISALPTPPASKWRSPTVAVKAETAHTQSPPASPVIKTPRSGASSGSRTPRNGRSRSNSSSSDSSSSRSQFISPADVEEQLNTQNRFKTEMCRTWEETGNCRYLDKCQFAHGRHELKAILRHPKFKSEKCRSFHTTGTCPYGSRCRFVHSVDEASKIPVNAVRVDMEVLKSSPMSVSALQAVVEKGLKLADDEVEAFVVPSVGVVVPGAHTIVSAARLAASVLTHVAPVPSGFRAPPGFNVSAAAATPSSSDSTHVSPLHAIASDFSLSSPTVRRTSPTVDEVDELDEICKLLADGCADESPVVLHRDLRIKKVSHDETSLDESSCDDSELSSASSTSVSGADYSPMLARLH